MYKKKQNILKFLPRHTRKTFPWNSSFHCNCFFVPPKCLKINYYYVTANCTNDGKPYIY